MEDQWESTKMSLYSTIAAACKKIQVVVLLNGSIARRIQEDMSARFPEVSFYMSRENLGVAGGRNYLMSTEEARKSDYIFHLDNDVLLCPGYFDEMASFLNRCPDAAVVGPLVFEASPILTMMFQQLCSQNMRTPVGELGCRLVFDNDRVKQSWLETDIPRLYHMGTNADWKTAYCRALPMILDFLNVELANRLKTKYNLHLRNLDNHMLVDQVKAGLERIEATNILGCATLYRKSLIEEIGGYDEAFNPYWYEDSELSIRALKAGFRNYVNPKVVLFHGTDFRSSHRAAYMSPTKQVVKNNVLIRRRSLDRSLTRAASIGAYSLGSLFLHVLRSIIYWDANLIKDTVLGIFEALRVGPPDHSKFLKNRCEQCSRNPEGA
ncbi:MAG: glycosyltransferase [Pseudomonadota bacterium]